MSQGYIKLFRKIQDWKYYRNPKMTYFWIHLLLQAHHGKNPIFDGHGNSIKTGQLSTGTIRLSTETGIPRSTLVGYLTTLKNEHQIDIKTTNKCSIITIVNWDAYCSTNLELDIKPTSTRHQTDIKPTQNKNVKNVKNVKNKNILDQIEKIYTEKYPRKIGKKKGMERLKSKIKTDEALNKFRSAVENYAEHVKNEESKFIKHFSTFANEWEDWSEHEKENKINFSLENYDESKLQTLDFELPLGD